MDKIASLVPTETSDNLDKIVTPKSINEQTPPDKLFVYTKKYGETTSTLKPAFEGEVKKYENTYEVDVPQEVMRICKEISGIGGRALLVGGSVRDTVISKEFPEFNIEPKDFDLEIYGISPQELENILGQNFDRNKMDNVGRAFGIIKVYIDGSDEPLDFSIPRRESSTGKAHTDFKVEGDPTMTLKEAAKRRDLTINTIAYDPLTKTLYDSYGGVEDIKNQIIEVTSIEAFQEDPLRVMRVMQFAARFGFTVSERTTKLCKEMVERGDLDNLARERIQEETNKLFSKGKRPSIGLNFAREIGFLEKYWPEAAALIDVPQEKDFHPEGDVWIHTLQVVDAAVDVADREIAAGRMKKDKLVLVLGALCHDFGKPSTTAFVDGAYRARGHEPKGVDPARTFLERIYSNEIAQGVSQVTKEILPLVAEHLKPREFWDNAVNNGINQDAAIRRLSNRLSKGTKAYKDGGNSSIYMLALVAEADQRGRNENENIFLKRAEVKDLDTWQTWLLNKAIELKVDQNPPELLLTGQAFKDYLGKAKSGPWIGAIMDMVYADQLDGTVKDATEALATAKAYYEVVAQKVKQDAAAQKRDEWKVWMDIRNLEDPRTYLEKA